MIRRLHVHGWRSFEEQSLDIGPGLTFVLAENGIGKTSLIEAAAWAVYGQASGVNAAAARRIGSAETRVQVDIELPAGAVLSIGRAMDRRGQMVVDATFGGVAVDPEALPAVLAEAYGASPDFLARTTAVPSSAVADEAAGAFVLREHLGRVLGVDDLNRAAERLEALHEQAEGEAKRFRTATRRASSDLAELAVQLTATHQQLAALEEQQAVRRQTLDETEEQLRVALRQAEAAQQRVAGNAAFEQVRSAAQAVLIGGPATPEARTVDALVSQLETAEHAALAGVDVARQGLAVLAARVETVTAAAAELDGVAGDCPVCRRPMSGDEVEHARRSHDADLTALHVQRTAQEDELGRVAGQLTAVRAVLRQALAVPTLIAAPAAPLDVEAAQSAVDGARAGVEGAREMHDEASAAVAAARGARSALATRIAQERAAADERSASLLAHRKAAMARMAAKVARTSADQLLTERIDPLAAEVRSRWKRVFGDRGLLQLGADGRLTLRRGVDEIPFEYLSSGEKVVALLAVRLLVLGSSTRASFLWLDEPLEHLDPRNRRLAASLMSAAGTQVRQILVTTYEEDLARRLARRGQASILRVRSADATWPSTGA